MRLSMGLASFLLLSLAAPRAFAQEAPGPAAVVAPGPVLPEEPTGPRREQVWYGWEPILTDVGSIALTGVALGTQNGAVGAFAAGDFLLASPAIHAIRGHVGKAMGSLVLRALLPSAGLLVGMGIGGSQTNGPSLDNWSGGIVGGELGFFGGALTAAIIDDVAIARDEVTLYPEREPAPAPPPTPGWHAGLAPTRGGATVGFGATF